MIKLEYLNTNIILVKVIRPNWITEIFTIFKVLNTNPITY